MNEEFDKFVEEVKGNAPKSVEEALGVEPVVLPEKEEESTDKELEPRKNRHHRRLEKQLEEERIARARSDARAEALLEMNVGKTSDEVDPLLIQLYGSEERGREAALIHQKLIDAAVARSEGKALEKFQAIQSEREQEVKQFESYLDTEFEALEDTYGVDLTSNAPAARKARNEMLEMLEDASPKDEEGNITNYASMDFVYKTYQATRKKDGVSQTQRDAASRTMVKGDVSTPQEKPRTPGMWGWRQDMGL